MQVSPTYRPSGMPAYGPCWAVGRWPHRCGVIAWNRTLATSADFAATGRSRRPLMVRSWMSNAKTSRRVVSSTKNSPGRVDRNRPNGPFGRSATERRCLASPKLYRPTASSLTRRYATLADGGVPPGTASAKARSALAMTVLRVGVDPATNESRTSRQAASHRGSTPRRVSLSKRASIRPAGPSDAYRSSRRSNVRTDTPIRAAWAATCSVPLGPLVTGASSGCSSSTFRSSSRRCLAVSPASATAGSSNG